MRLPDFLRTSSFRLAATYALTFALSAALLFAFIYWQTALYETARIDDFIARDARLIAEESPAERDRSVALRVTGDLHRITYAGVFDADGTRRAGNLAAVPDGLPPDGRAHPAEVPRPDGPPDTVRAAAVRLGDGGLLVIGRNIDELTTLRRLVLRALALGVLPATLLSLVAGAFVSLRAQQRVKAVHRSAERIMAGDLKERLPTHGTSDDFDRLAGSVNRMLDEIARLLDSVKAAGDDIAHDLRTPLARVRARLERGRAAAHSHEQLMDTVAAAIGDLDQALGVVTTLLRIGEIDSGRRRAGFAEIDLTALVLEIGQIYLPIAEDKGIVLATGAAPGLVLTADQGLLGEAIANLVQNAIKFTPPGGRVTLAAEPGPEGPEITVADNGPGIPPEERGRVFDRFYRLDKSRHVEGSGLGLSLVAAIARLHGYRIELDDNAPGARFRIICAEPGA